MPTHGGGDRPWTGRSLAVAQHHRQRALTYMLSADCPLCHGKRLRPESLSVTFAGLDLADLSRLPLEDLAASAAKPVRVGG